MYISDRLKALVVLMLFSFVLTTQIAQAGVFSDIKLWFSEKANIWQHSRAISSEVKTLYRERSTIKSFAEGASSLVKAYKSISNKNAKANFPQLLEIARAITQVVSGYQKLAPKAAAMYKRAKPSMQYFSELADQTTTIQTAKNRVMVKGFSNERLDSLAGANGWSRVFNSVKENPVNLFKWGRLKDEYNMGKIEAKYPLKCAQLAFEATAYFAAAKESVNELLGIKSEIDSIMGGNLEAILNIGGTVEKIRGVGNTAESLGELAERGTNLMNRRFVELVNIQQEYVETHKAYQQKYNKTERAEASNTGSYTPSPSASSGTTGSSVHTTGGIAGNSSTISLQQAMKTYQEAYETYIMLSQHGNADPTALKQAITDLQQAKMLVERAKAQAR
ncbi:MAG: hypothetical protein PWR01_2673 [Clostridiales bacterium]|nr:hypothetical protein [Clostridiales bacterium]MDN5281600.1 hypothetical protein [Candidatus Ozemobacter sp.]